jgi:hypothetical protein
MSSRGDSRAKILASLENRQASGKAPGLDSGPNAYDLLANYNQNTQSLKTLQTCFLDLQSNLGHGLAEYSQTWPMSGMMRNGTIYRLPTLVPGTDGAESGFLPTVIKSTASGSASNRWFNSNTYKANLHEYLRDGPEDPKHVNPEFCESLMGFPIGHTELQPAEIPLSPKSQN